MSTHHLSVPRAGFELTLATVFWGFGFVAARWALLGISPEWLTGSRFTLAFLITLAPMIWTATRRDFLSLRESLKLSFWPGIFLTLTIVFQTWGLMYTTATNASFITTLYVVFVPIMEAVLFKKRIELTHVILVVVAVLGTGLICDLQDNVLNKGDLLTVFCALAGAAHIVNISHVAGRIHSPFFFNNFQCFWAGIISMTWALAFEPPKAPQFTYLPVVGFCFLLFGSTLFGFMIQIRAQRVLTAGSASLICLLESPFGAFFAFVFLSEKLKWSQWSGALLISFSAIYTILLESRRNRSTPSLAKT